MTHIERAINEAVEKGGYDHRHNSDAAHLLDPLFWQALGKARGWGMVLGWEENYAPTDLEAQEWFIEWYKFIRHLAEEKDAESFFEDLK